MAESMFCPECFRATVQTFHRRPHPNETAALPFQDQGTLRPRHGSAAPCRSALNRIMPGSEIQASGSRARSPIVSVPLQLCERSLQPGVLAGCEYAAHRHFMGVFHFPSPRAVVAVLVASDSLLTFIVHAVTVSNFFLEAIPNEKSPLASHSVGCGVGHGVRGHGSATAK